METYRYHSTTVRWRTYEPSQFGVVEVAYFGPLGATEAPHLRVAVANATKDAPALVIRFDGVLLTFQEMLEVPVGVYGPGSPPGCTVCRPDQYEWISAYCRNMAKVGVMRVVFLQSQAASAYGLAETFARERIARLRLAQRSTPDSGFACL